jgi:hypothetical protein
MTRNRHRGVRCGGLVTPFRIQVQSLGKHSQTIQRKHAENPNAASNRCDRHIVAAHNAAKDPLNTPASNAIRALVCVANLPGKVRSRNQQAAVKQMKYAITVTALIRQIRCKVILPSRCNVAPHLPRRRRRVERRQDIEIFQNRRAESAGGG